MLIGEPTESPGDINFQLFGFPIRITPWFWFVTGMLGWGGSKIMGRVDPQFLVAWIIAAFVSILIHELGHAFAFRYYGVDSHIVLYQFGGLAIPSGYGMGRARSSASQIVISAAGPAAQFAGAIVLAIVLLLTRHGVPVSGFLAKLIPLPNYPMIDSVNLLLFVIHFLYISTYWALLNLLPIYPLDGGQIARHLFVMFGRGDSIKHSLILSVVAAAIMCIYSLKNQNTYMGLMFGMLGYSSYQALQPFMSGGGYNRPW
ncbi:MAG: hypothetical protein KDA92_16845 [Planctomycetales bacterium]|nr:hypothetical protein [Planctomycetales bacterium]